MMSGFGLLCGLGTEVQSPQSKPNPLIMGDKI
jgi:hypothetical protein